MSDQKIEIDDWLGAAVIATRDLASGALAIEQWEEGERLEKIPGDVWGSYVSIFLPRGSVDVGLFASEDACKALTQAFLQADQPSSDEDEVVDCVGELANIIVGTVKQHWPDLAPNFRLGLPIFLPAPPELDHRRIGKAQFIKMGSIDAHIWVQMTL